LRGRIPTKQLAARGVEKKKEKRSKSVLEGKDPCLRQTFKDTSGNSREPKKREKRTRAVARGKNFAALGGEPKIRNPGNKRPITPPIITNEGGGEKVVSVPRKRCPFLRTEGIVQKKGSALAGVAGWRQGEERNGGGAGPILWGARGEKKPGAGKKKLDAARP